MENLYNSFKYSCGQKRFSPGISDALILCTALGGSQQRSPSCLCCYSSQKLQHRVQTLRTLPNYITCRFLACRFLRSCRRPSSRCRRRPPERPRPRCGRRASGPPWRSWPPAQTGRYPSRSPYTGSTNQSSAGRWIDQLMFR